MKGGLKLSNITSRFSRLFSRNRPIPVNRTNKRHPSLNRTPFSPMTRVSVSTVSPISPNSTISPLSLNRNSNNLNFKSLGPLLILGALPTDFGKNYNDSERKKINRSIRASNNIYYLNRVEANSRNNFPYAVKISNAERKRYFQVNLTQRGNFTKLHEYHDFFKTIVFDLGVWHHLFDHELINDEYQDASPQMDLIVNLLKKGGKIYLMQTPKYNFDRYGRRIDINEDKTDEYYKDIMTRFEEAGLSVEKDITCKEIAPMIESRIGGKVTFIVGEKI